MDGARRMLTVTYRTWYVRMNSGERERMTTVLLLVSGVCGRMNTVLRVWDDKYWWVWRDEYLLVWLDDNG